MDFSFSLEEKALADSFRDFLHREVLPREEELKPKYLEADGDSAEVREEIRRMRQRSAELGFYSVDIPTEIGGGGLSFVGQASLREVAGATGSFADLNGDNCARAGAGFTNFSKDGPFTLASPPAAPQPYDTSSCPAGSACSTAVSAGIALNGGGPLFDIGFIAVLTNAAMTRLPTQACSCAQAPGCPE